MMSCTPAQKKSEFEEPFFKNDRDEPDITTSPEFMDRYGWAIDETSTNLDTISENWIFPPVDTVHGGNDTDHDSRYKGDSD